MKDSDRIAALEKKVQEMSQQLGVLQDIHEVRTLHFKYGYYMDRCLFDAVVDLFAESCEIYFLGGLFRGKAGARRLYGGASGLKGPAYGMIFDHLLLQDIVDVAPDRMTAQGRFRCFMQGGVHESRKDAPAAIPAQFWEGGVYENIYIKEDGVWKFQVFDYTVVWQAPYERGWAHSGAAPLMVSRFEKTFPDNPYGPDEIVARAPRMWPDMYLIPFHYPHPVTGEWVK